MVALPGDHRRQSEPEGEGQRVGVRVRCVHRRLHRDARRGRLDRPGGDPEIRERTCSRRRLRQGLSLHAGRGELGHLPSSPVGEFLAQQAGQRPLRHPLYRPVLRIQRLPAGLPRLDRARCDGPARCRSDGHALGRRLRGRTLINVRIAKAGLRVFEVPSFERNRIHGSSNLNAFSDGLRVLQTIRIEHKRGVRRATFQNSMLPRDDGESWSVLSTVSQEAG